MKCTCKQCGKEFELEASEIRFYKSRNLNLPKRCKECRDKNKQRRHDEKPIKTPYKAEEMKTGNFSKAAAAVVLILALCAAFLLTRIQDGGRKQDFGMPIVGTQESVQREELAETKYAEDAKIPEAGTEESAQKGEPAETKYTETAKIPEAGTEEATQREYLSEAKYTETAEKTQAAQTSLGSKTFRSAKLLNEHYEKHGVAMGFPSAGEYEAAAAKVVENPYALHKLEAEDGDGVYYLESTNEFVIVSTDGYIRTYFFPEDGIEYFNRQ